MTTSKQERNYRRGPGEAPRRVSLSVPDALAGERMDRVLHALLPDYSRSYLQGLIEAGKVTLAGLAQKPKTRLRGGERVEVELAPRVDEAPHRAEARELAVLYEDDQVLVIDKPAGLVIHPGAGNPAGTLLNALLHHAPQVAHLPRAGIVHRLDKDTSGVLVVAKTETALASLAAQLKARSMRREYVALVHGALARDARVEAPIGRHPSQRTKMAVVSGGRPAVTHVDIIERLDGATLARCRLETGRTHQIRVHMQHLGHPIVGDPTYGRARTAGPTFTRQALHAARLAFVHPTRQTPIAIDAPPPADMQALIDSLRSRA